VLNDGLPIVTWNFALVGVVVCIFVMGLHVPVHVLTLSGDMCASSAPLSLTKQCLASRLLGATGR
jgi:hypothetical protein